MHPVIVGKRALPALAVRPSPGRLADRLALVARPADIVMAFGEADEDELRDALARAGDAAA